VPVGTALEEGTDPVAPRSGELVEHVVVAVEHER
jgi:hypothetical protein